MCTLGSHPQRFENFKVQLLHREITVFDESHPNASGVFLLVLFRITTCLHIFEKVCEVSKRTLWIAFQEPTYTMNGTVCICLTWITFCAPSFTFCFILTGRLASTIFSFVFSKVCWRGSMLCFGCGTLVLFLRLLTFGNGINNNIRNSRLGVTLQLIMKPLSKVNIMLRSP